MPPVTPPAAASTGTNAPTVGDPVGNPVAKKVPIRRVGRTRVLWLSRSVTLAAVLGAIGSLLVVPQNAAWYVADILLRTWLAFVGTVMAHEATHGLLGRTRRSNGIWGRIALLPSMVPYADFRDTHLRHHRYTNEPDRDPDHLLAAGREWSLPIRALAMPHHWLAWLWRRNEVDGRRLLDLTANYAIIAVAFAPAALLAGPWRIVFGMAPVVVLLSLLLWIPFAYMTHEGWSTGAPETRSHNWYGRFMYWFSLGLSVHRAHHMRPHLAWIELRQFVERAPGRGRFGLPSRDIRAAPR